MKCLHCNTTHDDPEPGAVVYCNHCEHQVDLPIEFCCCRHCLAHWADPVNQIATAPPPASRPALSVPKPLLDALAAAGLEEVANEPGEARVWYVADLSVRLVAYPGSEVAYVLTWVDDNEQGYAEGDLAHALGWLANLAGRKPCKSA